MPELYPFSEGANISVCDLSDLNLILITTVAIVLPAHHSLQSSYLDSFIIHKHSTEVLSKEATTASLRTTCDASTIFFVKSARISNSIRYLTIKSNDLVFCHGSKHLRLHTVLSSEID